MPTAREFDLVLYGATGFVGSLTAWYLAAAAPAGARIALAGRSPERLAALRSRLAGSNLPGGDWPVLTADAMSETETAELAGRTKVMVTTVGPYLRYGLPLAGACARAGTHYADLTGETLFARECIDRYHSIATQSGARIVNSCGVDSIPSDLSMLALHRRVVSEGGAVSDGGAASDGAGDLTDATMAVTWRGAMSGGTIDSGRAQQEALARDPKLRALVRDPYALSPDRAREPDLGPQSDRALGRASGLDPRLRGWVTTFLMAPYNTRVVRRSNALLDWAYGKNLRYREVLRTGHSPAAAAIAAGTAGALAAYDAAGPLLTRGIGKRLFDAAAPAPGTGPGQESRRRGFFTMRTFAKTSTGAAYTATFAAQGDPGYSATSVMLGESGLALAFDESRLPAASGVLTPAVALGEVLAERLRAAGMTIEATKSQSLSRTPHCPSGPAPLSVCPASRPGPRAPRPSAWRPTAICGRMAACTPFPRGGAVDAEELVGRDSELTLLTGLVRDVSAGRGGALLIEGEPGIGKSALVRAALAGAGDLGCEVFWGTGDELDQALPLVPFLKALRVREVTSPRRTAIARLLAGENAGDHGADVPAVLAEQLLALIAEECAKRPVILVIDDLQWADPDSVRLWGRLIRTARQMPLLLAGLMRPVPRREDLLAVRRMAAKDTRLRLSELPDDAVGGLVATLSGGVPDAGLLKLAATAGGNPLYLTELVAVLRRSSRIAIGGTGTAALTEGPVPGSLSAAIADRLGFVSGEVRDVLHAAALLGVNFEISDLAIVSGRGGVAGLLGILDEALTAGVLAESREGFGFRHPLIRAALYEEMPAPVRATWHRDAGRALAAAGVPAYRVARQLLQAASRSSETAGSSGSVGSPEAPGSPTAPGSSAAPGSSGGLVDEWMLNWIDGAADSLVGPAPGVAAELLPLAIAACPGGSARQVRLVSRLADALYRIGDRPGAERQAMRVLDHATDRDVLMDLHWTLAQCRMLAGRSPESLAVLDQALAAPGISDRHRARLLVLASRTHFMDGHMKEAARVADTALTAASAAGDTWAKAWALQALANARMAQGDVFESLSMHDRAIAVTQSDPALSDMRLLLQINKAATLGNIDQYEQAFAVLRSVLELAGQTGTALRQSQAHSAFAQMYFESGRWDDALAEIAILPLDLNEPAGACCEYGVAAVICFHRGETDTARRHLADAAPYAERIGKHRVVPPLVLARSMERESEGAVQEALAVLTDAFANSPDEVQATEELLPDTVRLALLTGDPRTAESVAARADAGAGSEIPHRQAVALYCRGLLAHDAARLLKAAERYTQAGHPLMKAKALEAAAAEFTRTGDQGQARTALDAAAAAYTSVGATADLARLRLQPRG